MLHGYKELIVWKKSMKLVSLVYKITIKFPKEELYCLVSQIRKCAISIPSNIAEGRMRGTSREYVQFLRIAYGSGAELETQLEIAKDLKYISQKDSRDVELLLEEVMKMLNSMINKINPNELSS